MRLKRTFIAGLVVAGLVTGIAGVAVADTVATDPADADVVIVGGVRSVSLDLDTAPSVGVTFKLTQENDPGNLSTNCNVDATHPATFQFVSSPAGVTAPNISFTTCTTGASSQSSTFTPPAAGSYVITLQQTTTRPGITTNGATFTLNVTGGSTVNPCAGRTAPAAPTIIETNSPDAITGWYNSDSDDAKFTVSPSTDAEYRVNGATWTAYTGAVTLGEGEHSVEARRFLPVTSDPCDRVDGAVSAATDIDVDTIAPSATPASVADTTWRNTSLSQEFTFEDTGSGLASGQGLVDGKATLTVSAESPDATTPTSTSKTVSDVAGNETTRSVSAFIDLTKPTSVVTGVTDGGTYVLGDEPTPGCEATDSLSGPAAHGTATVTGGSGIGTKSVTCNGATDVAGNTQTAASAAVTYKVVYGFTGFGAPVDNNGILNKAKAGQAIPLKFRVTDADGTGITTLTSVSVTVKALACSVGTTADLLEEYAAGSSGLQNLGDGYYQFNWKTPTTYAKSCKTMTLNLGDGNTDHTALFEFLK